MNQKPKTRNTLQGELFETHDITWSMLSEEQQQQVVELLSKLFLGALCTEPISSAQVDAPETNHE